MLKHEDWPGLTKITAIRDMEKQGDGPRMSILCGNGGLYLPQELARGADGAMTGFAYPEALVRTVELFQQGKQDEAEDFFDAYIPILRHEQQPGFGPGGAQIRAETARYDRLRRNPRTPAARGCRWLTGRRWIG